MSTQASGVAVRSFLGAGLGLGAVVASGIVLAGPAAARPSADTRDLCDAAPVACSVQVPSTWRAGSTQQIVVTGNAGVKVTVRGVRVLPAASGGGYRFEDEVKDVTLTTDADGFARADVSVAANTDGGDVLFVIADAAPANLEEVLGGWATVLGRTPQVQGDGYGTTKPVGTDLQLDLVAASPGARYEVEMKVAGAWTSVAVGSASSCDDDGTCRVRYEVPRGLAAKKHEFRLVHVESGAPVADWTAVPDADGQKRATKSFARPEGVGGAVTGSLAADVSDVPVTADRLANLQIPDVGADLAFAAPRAAHDVTWVRTAAVASGALALLWALLLLLNRRAA